jgi:hypothetical protein
MNILRAVLPPFYASVSTMGFFSNELIDYPKRRREADG